MKQQLHFTVNGESHELEVEPNRTLLEVLRTDLGLTAAKNGCNMSVCGTCSVILDGRIVNSCSVLALEAKGKSVTTLEGLGTAENPHPLQKAFIEYGAIQCGFCTPGMLLSAKVLLDENPMPTESEVRRALMGNLCRCTGYAKIVEAIKAVAEQSL